MKAQNKKDGKVVEFSQLPSGRYKVEADGEQKTIAESTFKRWYTIIEEDNKVEDDIKMNVNGKDVKPVEKEENPVSKPVEKKEVKKEVKEPKQEKPEQPKSAIGKADVIKFVKEHWEKDITMTDRDTGVIKSKYGEKPKYFDTFNFFDLTLQMTYIHTWGSTGCELYDDKGHLIFKSDNGTLKPMMNYLKFSTEQMKYVRQRIRMERKAWDGDKGEK